MKHLLTLTFLLSTIYTFGQERNIHGTIENYVSNKRNIAILTTLGDTIHIDQNNHFSFATSGKYFIVNVDKEYRDTIWLTKSNVYIVKLRSLNELQEVIVNTSISKHKSLLNNPVAIVAISSRQLEKSVAPNPIEALAINTPGLSAAQTGPNISKPFIRGLGYNRVLTLFDGIRQEGQQWGDEHGMELDGYNVASAEVIKGPSSLIYGSDAEAGVVSIQSAIPTNDDNHIHGKWSSEYQSNNGLIGNGLNIYQKNKHWAWIASGSYKMAKNYKNGVDGRVYNTGFKETNAAIGLFNYRANGTTALHFTLYSNLQGIPDGSRDSLSRKFTKQIYEADDDDITARPIVSDQELNSYTLSPLHQHIQHYRIYLNEDIHFKNGGYFKGIIAFQQNVRKEYNHPTLPEQAGMSVRLNTFNYTLSYHLPQYKNWENNIGINGMMQSNKNKDATDFPIPDYHLWDIGAYLFSRYTINKFAFIGGIRVDKRYIKGDDYYTATNITTGLNQHLTGADTIGAYLQFPYLNTNFTGISGSLGTTYEFNEYWHLKFNIARGYRAPNLTEIASNGLDPGAHIYYIGSRTFKPEFNLQEDIGIDFDIPSTLNVSASIFHNYINNYISLLQLVDANNNPIQLVPGNWTYQYQQTSARLVGFEVNGFYTPHSLKGFSINSALSAVYGNNTNKKYKHQGVNGEYLSMIPPMKWLSTVEQNIDIHNASISQVSVSITSDVNARQSRYFGLYNTETTTAGFVLWNASVGVKWHYVKNHAIDIRLFAQNIFDKAYQSNMSRLKYFEYYQSSPNGHLGIYNMGRNVGIKLIMPF